MTKEQEPRNINGESGNRITTERTVAPAVEIQELPESYIVRLDIPGATKESMKAQVRENTLTVTASAQAYFKQDATLLYNDSMPKEYRREFSLADDIDPHAIEAVFDMGVLSLTLKKKLQCLPIEISIQ